MELSWSTFLLEIVNFLVLVWILKRFLYKPVLNAVARRRENIAQTLEAARQERETGEALRGQYERRLSDWEREREEQRRVLQREMDAERARRREALAAEIDDERRKAQVLADRERGEIERRLETQALRLGTEFAARLLTRVAGPELESRLVEAAREDIDKLSAEQRRSLEQALKNHAGQVDITSARRLEGARREGLETALSDLAGGPVAFRYRVDAELIGGLQVSIGAWVLHANLRDGLRSFAEAGRGR
ncbi:MAG: F0F1 ATP synthase subunit delta [Pseudomonadota bacterium]|nr:F0F1 ATP synthase subunit delta [Pseudomonadota bacterium]